MLEVLIDDEKQVLTLQCKQECHQFLYCWLLENCRCSDCWNSSSLQRQVEPSTARISIQQHEVEGESLFLTFQSGYDKRSHRARYSQTWLQQRAKQFVRQESIQIGYSPSREALMKPKLWYGPSTSSVPAKFNYSDIVSQPTCHIQFVEHLETFGLVVVKNVPTNPGLVQKFGELIAGYCHPTHYGTTFDVIAVENPNNQAYTSRKLALHTDLPVRRNPPEIQMLHCIKQAENGGESTFSDGFYAAKVLQEQQPLAFEILTKTFVKFVDYSSKFHYEGHKITIEVTPTGNHTNEVTSINLNDVVRDSILELPIEEHQAFFDAYCQFKKILEDGIKSFRLCAGDLVCFDNRRVLHGRQEFVATGDTSRFLQGSYVMWEDVISIKNVLKSLAQ